MMYHCATDKEICLSIGLMDFFRPVIWLPLSSEVHYGSQTGKNIEFVLGFEVAEGSKGS